MNKYRACERDVIEFDERSPFGLDEYFVVATARSKTLAKRIANALNIYKPKRRKSREQEKHQ